MTYLELLNSIKSFFNNHKLISFVEEGDVYTINDYNIDYPAIVISVTQPHIIGNPESTFNFTIFYIDRLTKDSSNKSFIHNAAIKVFNDFISTYEDTEYTQINDNISITLFTEKFTDECAGGFINIPIVVQTNFNECDKIN